MSYASFLAGYRASLDFISVIENDPSFDALFNEEIPEMGIPKGAYEKFKFRFLHVGRALEFCGDAIGGF